MSELFARSRPLLRFLLGLVIGCWITGQFRALRFTDAPRRASCPDIFVSEQSSRQYTTVSDLKRRWDVRNVSVDSNLLFVGIMTAQKYLDTRALSIHRTWGKEVAGRYAFFSSSSSRSEFVLPIVQLPTVDDSYPPQKKSFLMLKFIHDHFIDQFEWFMRADDDVYVNTEKLASFLRTIDSSKAHFIGQAGVGNKEEFGQLGLKPEENFCMGGPGVIISRAALIQLAPHIQKCLKHLYSTHEDVEIGRCVRQFVEIPCTWAYEMQSLFYHNFSGEINPESRNLMKIYRNAITLHPIKHSPTMYKMHRIHLQERHRQSRLKLSQLQRKADSAKLRTESQRSSRDESLFRIYSDPSSHARNESQPWEFISKNLYASKTMNPNRFIEKHIRRGLDNNIIDIMRYVNKLSKQNHRVIEFKNVYYGYLRQTPQGICYILDLLMVYKRYVEPKINVPVRRHAYGCQTFSEPRIRQIEFESLNTTVNLVLALSGRNGPLKRFARNFAHLFASDGHVSLAVVLFPDGAESEDELREAKAILNSLINSGMPVKIAQLGGTFSRAAGLQRGASLFAKESLLLFVDVDMHIDESAIRRVRLNTHPARQVYYPIVFSQYAPQYVPVEIRGTLNLTTESGYWRQFGYGIVSLYNSDMQFVGGMNVAIQGWGQEDVDLVDRFVRSNISVFRAPDPGFVHIYHEIKCSSSLSAAQMEMCTGTKLNSLGSTKALVQSLNAVH